MRKNNRGNIILISAANANLPIMGQSNYSASKNAIIAFNRCIALENANKMVDLQKKLTGPLTTSGFIIIFNLFIGFIVSLIGGLIFNKSQIE